MNIRNITKNEVLLASHLADSIYSHSFYESDLAFYQKYDIHPLGCFAAFNEYQMIGYIFSHPWDSSVVSLDEIISLPDSCDSFYIHDLAVLPDFRGQNIASKLAHAVINHGISLGFHQFNLISVNQTEHFWAKFGFKIIHPLTYGNSPAFKMSLIF